MDKLKNFERLVQLCLKTAYEIYDIPEQNVEIKFTLRGRSAGRAGYMGYYSRYCSNRKYFLNFSKKAILENYEYMVKNTISHEIAHLVAWMKPELGAQDHNDQWAKIDKSLGGIGQRYHSLGNISSVRRARHVYLVDGKKFTLSTMKHNKIQQYKVQYFSDRSYTRPILPTDYKETFYI